MTDTVKFTTVTAAIAASSITVTRHSGATGALKIKDVGTLPQAIPTEQCPILAPRASNFCSNVQVVRDTFGADAALKTISYDLAYQLFFYPLGEGLKWVTYYGAMVTCAMEILLWFATNTNSFVDDGAHEFMPAGIPVFDPQVDAAGTPFHGCQFLFHVQQFMES